MAVFTLSLGQSRFRTILQICQRIVALAQLLYNGNCNLAHEVVVIVAIQNNTVCIICASLSLSFILCLLDLTFPCTHGVLHHKIVVSIFAPMISVFNI